MSSPRLPLPPLLLLLPLTALAAGCATAPKQEPVVASAAKQSAYAVGYPAELQNLQSEFAHYRQEAHKAAGEFARYPDELKAPPWDVVSDVVERSDEAGKSAAYVSEQRSQREVQVFFSDERDEINKRVAGSVQYALQQKGCNADAGGAATFALKEAVEKRLEKRLRAANDAHALIEREHVALGKENTAALERQADGVSGASYFTFVALVDVKVRLRGRLDDADQVKKTLDDAVREENAWQAAAGRGEAEKRGSADRVRALNQSKAQIDGAANQGRELLKRVDDEVKAAQKEYEDALAALKGKIKEKQKAQGVKK